MLSCSLKASILVNDLMAWHCFENFAELLSFPNSTRMTILLGRFFPLTACLSLCSSGKNVRDQRRIPKWGTCFTRLFRNAQLKSGLQRVLTVLFLFPVCQAKVDIQVLNVFTLLFSQNSSLSWCPAGNLHYTFSIVSLSLYLSVLALWSKPAASLLRKYFSSHGCAYLRMEFHSELFLSYSGMRNVIAEILRKKTGRFFLWLCCAALPLMERRYSAAWVMDQRDMCRAVDFQAHRCNRKWIVSGNAFDGRRILNRTSYDND